MGELKKYKISKCPRLMRSQRAFGVPRSYLFEAFLASHCWGKTRMLDLGISTCIVIQREDFSAGNRRENVGDCGFSSCCCIKITHGKLLPSSHLQMPWYGYDLETCSFLTRGKRAGDLSLKGAKESNFELACSGAIWEWGKSH